MYLNRVKKLFTIIAASGIALSAQAEPAPTILTIKETITDDAIVFPESFETDTNEMLTNWYIQNYTVLDDNVEYRSANEVSDEEYIKRLKALPTVIEMPYNKVVKSYINMYIEKRRMLVETMLGMSLYYMPIFEQALEQEGMPLELKYLPVIESALNPNAVSRVGATGLWQFMLGTAKGLGLEINSLVDERRDPYRSSAMAAKYLKELHGIYNDWSLAIAAYNCGPGNVNKALRRAGGDNKDFWAIYQYLPTETRGYVPAFIAANYVMTYFKQHNISPSLAKRPLITDTIHVTKRVNLNQVSEVLNIPMNELRVLNPHFRKDIIPGDNRPYALSLPSQQVYSYIMSEDSIVNHKLELYAQRDVVEPTVAEASKADVSVKYHKVKSQETLSSIAKKYGVTVNDLKKWNKITRNRVIRGQTLKISYAKDSNDVDSSDVRNTEIAKADTKKPKVEPKAEPKPKSKSSAKPEGKSSSKTSTASNNKKKTPSYNYHTVKKGESLSKIADKYRGVSIADIQKANGIKGTKIKAGDKIKIPKKL